MGIRILRCNTCGNIIAFHEDSGVTPQCCGHQMEELKFNEADASLEKHLPYVRTEHVSKPDHCNGTKFTHRDDCNTFVTVKVGETPHPMTDDHYIEWICLETNCGTHTRYFDPGDDAENTFCLCRCEKPEAVYAYCNLHGLWRTLV